MKKIIFEKNNNSKLFDVIVNNTVFSKKIIKKNLFNTTTFFSLSESKIKENLRKLEDQRCVGYVNTILERNDKGVIFLKKHREQGNLKARLINNYNRNDELIIINTAGGLTSGDCNFNSVEIKNNIVLNITTQSMEKIYKCKNLFSYAYTNIKVGSNSYVSWMPLETIFFNEGKLRRRINVDLDKSSHFLGIETIIFGRKAMGEIINKGELNDAWQIYKDGKLIYSDFNKINGNINNKILNPFILKGNNIICNIIYTGNNIKSYSKKLLNYLKNSNYFSGISLVNEILVIKVLAKDILEIRNFLDDLILIFDNNFNLPKIWSC